MMHKIILRTYLTDFLSVNEKKISAIKLCSMRDVYRYYEIGNIYQIYLF